VAKKKKIDRVNRMPNPQQQKMGTQRHKNKKDYDRKDEKSHIQRSKDDE
jgi:hypothetical protein